MGALILCQVLFSCCILCFYALSYVSMGDTLLDIFRGDLARPVSILEAMPNRGTCRETRGVDGNQGVMKSRFRKTKRVVLRPEAKLGRGRPGKVD